ncbi:DUF4352 domain-containing protein [Collinsella sp. An2]|uniref:DUF4352 domain-containing protein n=1 Tax=Collinsella sp. An2 TaxID=1965585 RepID=UPI000B3A14A6|nr:DUF4352 domain-containing protein [Collinsella sp. An2]OUP07095.1 hypothetical protein B5F33_09435 [Collinsella sp. An2]
MSDLIRRQPRSVAAIVGLVLGIIAVIISWIPIVNNLAFVVGIVGVVFAIVGLVGTRNGEKAGRGPAIAGLIVNIVALAIVFGTQSMYGAAIDGPAASSTSTSDDAPSNDTTATDESTDAAGAGAAEDYTDLAVGTSVNLENGLVVTVDSVQAGLTNYDGSSVVGIQVTYVNNGDEGANYNPYDWKGQDAQGAQESSIYYADGTNQLSAGTLAAGGSVTGNIYFAGDTVMALYFSSMLSDTPTASWTLA